MHMPRVIAVVAAMVFSTALAPRARADPLFGWGQNALEDAYDERDFDEEDLVAARTGAFTTALDMHGQSWVSLVGLAKWLRSGKRDYGGMVVVGIAFDRIAAGKAGGLADPVHLPVPAQLPADTAAPRSEPAPVPPKLARSCVAAALRASGLGLDDAKLDALVTRARESAYFPETRLRAMRLWSDADHVTTLATTDTPNFYDAVGANLVLELRLTWRFDRLLYSGEESAIERVRLERQDARARLATHVLEVLFAWQRAMVQAREAVVGTREEAEAHMRIAETEATLDVLTAGWFSHRDDPPPPPKSESP
ncbi:MAG TPA: hypothetical protein VF765_02480 [Polyangiaceae bacterium]